MLVRAIDPSGESSNKFMEVDLDDLPDLIQDMTRKGFVCEYDEDELLEPEEKFPVMRMHGAPSMKRESSEPMATPKMPKMSFAARPARMRRWRP